MSGELTARRRSLALLSLALGGFGIGASEFVAMGLLPEIVTALLPDLWAGDQEAAVARGGLVISTYALGVVLGAFTVAIATVRVPRKAAVVAFCVAFTFGSILSGSAESFELLIAARLLTGLPHGAYFGFASLIAGQLMGPGSRGKGIAMVLSGLTISNIIGVPALTLLGQHLGWRAAFYAVGGIFAAAAAAIAVTIPWQPGNAGASMVSELRIFRSAQVWLALAIGAIGFGGFFAVFTYVSPILTELAGLPVHWVSAALVVIGVGMTTGNFLGGRWADTGSLRALIRCFPYFIATLVILGLFADRAAILVIFLFLMAVSSMAMMPMIQTRLLDVSNDGQTLASALNHASLNIGNSLGAALGGAVIAAGFGLAAPAWAGVGLAIVGFGLALVAAALERRQRRA